MYAKPVWKHDSEELSAGMDLCELKAEIIDGLVSIINTNNLACPGVRTYEDVKYIVCLRGISLL